MGTHGRAQHLGRPAERRAGAAEHLFDAGGGGAAQDRADVAGILDGVQHEQLVALPWLSAQDASKELGWTVVAGSAVLQQAGEGVQTGGMTSLEVRGRQGYACFTAEGGLRVLSAAYMSEPGALKRPEVAPPMRLAIGICLVAVVGLGGLGHMAVKFARAWGCEVTAFTSSESKYDEAGAFGAHHVVASRDSGALARLAGSLDFLLITVNVPMDWNALMATLAPKAPPEPKAHKV